jgi:anti-anti-sigma factor
LSSVAVHSIVHTVQTDLNDGLLLTLTGRLDAEAAQELAERCDQLIQNQTRTLIVDVGTLGYLSSAGLRTLLGAGKNLQSQNRKLVLVAAPGPVRQIIEVAGFDKIFPIYATVDEAVNQTAGKSQVSHTKEWGADVLTVSGRVDAERAPDLEKAGRRILEKDYLKLIINLSAVQYLSSAGLCALLNLAKLAKARQSRLILCGPTPAVRQVLKLSGFDKILPISEELSEALAL